MEERINKLYELVLKWDATCSQVPALVKRLQTLAKLHEQGDFNELHLTVSRTELQVYFSGSVLFSAQRDDHLATTRGEEDRG